MSGDALGIDIGTSGLRACLIDARGKVIAQQAVELPAPQRHGDNVEQDPGHWLEALEAVLDALRATTDLAQVRHIAVDATSATLLYCDPNGGVLTPALMYNDARARDEARRLAEVAPADSAVHSPSSGLAKALWLQGHYNLPAGRFLHQADWLTGCLTGRFDLSDENNALKLGYDPRARAWPAWLTRLGLVPDVLPKVVAPGTPIGPLRRDLAHRWGLERPQVHAGTTDSTAAFIATGASQPGDAVTSLGSTLVVKVLSEQALFAPEYGIYSQRLGALWLVGGASNSGGAVLRQFFTDAQLAELTRRVRPDQPTNLSYYPLPAPGERFPICDPTLAPRMTPRPADDAHFLQGLLEGIAAIEHQGYQRLTELGTPYPTRVLTVGGGASNPFWTRIRGRLLGVPVATATQQEAAYGTALLAQRATSTAAP